MKRNFICIIITICISVCSFNINPITVGAEEVFVDGYYLYTVSDEKATIYGINGELSGNITIPEQLGGYSVTEIGYASFQWCVKIVSVSLPDSVTTINDAAFNGCINLEYIEMSDNITFIGEDAFLNCAKLKSIVVPRGVTSLSDSAFGNCDSLTEVVLSENLKTIGEYTFAYCVNLKEIIIPDQITDIGNCAFLNCISISNIHMGKSVTNIGIGAFYNCNSLTSINIPSEVTSIGEQAFSYCTSLVAFDLQNNVEYYFDSNALFNKNRTKLIQYTLSKENTTYVVPDTVEEIGTAAFAGSLFLQKVIIGENVHLIQGIAFADCFNINEFQVDSENQYYCSLNGALFNKDLSKLIQYPIGNSRDTFSIPNGTTTIETYAFGGCEMLNNVVFSDSVETINWGAFMGCCNLNNIFLPQNLLAVEQLAFCGCSKLESISIPHGVSTIGSGAFENCVSLKNVLLEEGIEYIGSGAFSDCKNLENVIIPKSVQKIDIGAFSGCDKLKKIVIKNPICEIDYGIVEDSYGNRSFTIPINATIYGYLNSTAHQYAVDKNIVFLEISEQDDLYSGTISVVPSTGNVNSNYVFMAVFSEIPKQAFLQFDSKGTNYDYLSDSSCISNPAFKIDVNDYSLQDGKYVYTKTLAINDSGNPSDNYNRKVRIIYKDNSGNTYYSTETRFVVNPAAEKLDKPVVLSPTYNQKFEIENDVELVWNYSGDVEPDEYIVNVYNSNNDIVYSKIVSDTELTISAGEISNIGTYTAYIYAKKSNYENSEPASTVFIVKEKKVDCFISDITPKEGKAKDTFTFSFTSSKKLTGAYILFDNPKESGTVWLDEKDCNIPEFRFDVTDYEINDDGDYVYTKNIAVGTPGNVSNDYIRKFRVAYCYLNWLIPTFKKSDINEFTVTKNDVKGITDAVIEEVGANYVTVSAMPTGEYNSSHKGAFSIYLKGKCHSLYDVEGKWDGEKYIAKIAGLNPLTEYGVQAILKDGGIVYAQPSSSTPVQTTDYTPPIVEMKDISVRGTRVLLTATVKDTSGSDMSYYGFALRWGEDGYEDLRASNYNKNTGEFSYDISVLKNGGGLSESTEFTVIPYAKNKKATAQGEGAMQTFKTGSAGIHFVDSRGDVINKRLYKNVGSKMNLKTNIYGSDYTSLKYVVYNKSYGEVYPTIDVDLHNTSATIDTSSIQAQDLIIEAHLQLADGSVAKTVLEVTLTVPVTGIEIIQDNITTTIGQKITIIPEITPSNATNKSYNLHYDKTIGVIEIKGKDIIAKKAGQQYVTFTTVDGNYSHNVLVTVENVVDGAPSLDDLFTSVNTSIDGPEVEVSKDGKTQSHPLAPIPFEWRLDATFMKFYVENNKLKVFAANFPVTDIYNGIVNDEDMSKYTEFEKYKKAGEKYLSDNSKNHAQNNSFKDGKWDIYVFFEYDYTDGKLGEFLGGGGGVKYTLPKMDKVVYYPLVVPVYTRIKTTLRGSAELGGFINPKPHFGVKFKPEVELEIGGGTGLHKVAYIEVVGDARGSLPIEMDYRGIEVNFGLKLHAKAEARFLMFSATARFPKDGLVNYEKTIIPFQNNLSLMSIDEMYINELYEPEQNISEISRDYLNIPSSFNTGFANQISLLGLNDEGTKIDQLVKNNIYPDNEVTSIELLDGRTLMVWVDDVGLERTSLNRTGLYYSICENGVWSMPQRVDPNDYTADFSPELSNNNGEVYLSWQSADCIFEDGTELDNYYTHIGVSSMKFDGDKFVERQNFYSQDSKYRNMQKTISDGSKTATLWVTNSENDYTGLTGTNAIHYSECIDGVWSEEKIIIENIPYLMEYSASYNNGEIIIAYAADTDKNLASEEDINIYLCDETGNASVVSSGTSYNPIISNGILYWAQEDTVHSCDINNITDVNDVVANNGKVYDFELFSNGSNKMIYWADGSNIYASMCNNDVWSTPSVCTTVSGTINSISASGDDGTEFIVSVKREDSDTVDMIVCNVVEKVDLAVSEYVSYEETDIVPDGNLEVEISIENQGNISVETAEVSFVDDEGNVLQTIEKDLNLKPYDSKALTVTYKLPSEIEQQPITILVNPIGYEDSDDSDNSASINIGNPELIIENAETIYENGVPYIKLSVENSGYTAIKNVPVNIKYNDETIITETFTVNAKSSAEKLIVVDKSRFDDAAENVWLTAQIQTDKWNLGYNDTETFLFINNEGENELYIQSAEVKNNILSLEINNKQAKEFTGTLNVVETYTDGTQHVELFNVDMSAKPYEEVQVALKPEKSLSNIEVSVYDGTSIRSNEVMYALSGYSIIDAKSNNGKIDVTVEKDDTNGHVIVALYNDKGMMVALSKHVLTADNTYSFDICDSTAINARIFIWSISPTLKPLCGAYELVLR